MSEWKPIETAPKDGAEILAWGPSFTYLVVSYDEGHDHEFPWLTLDGPYYRRGAFTHWMPLPEPPKP